MILYLSKDHIEAHYNISLYVVALQSHRVQNRYLKFQDKFHVKELYMHQQIFVLNWKWKVAIESFRGWNILCVIRTGQFYRQLERKTINDYMDKHNYPFSIERLVY